MTRFSLDGGQQASLGRTPVVVRVSGPDDGVHIDASTLTGEPFRLRRANGLAIVPTLNEAIVISVSPERGTLFAPGSSIDVTLGAEHDDDADYVHTWVEPAGLPRLEVLRVEPRAQRLTVTALGRPAEPSLSPLADAARGFAREQLGVMALPAERQLDLQIALDASPSMRSYLVDGVIAGLLEILVGVASAVDPDRQLDGVVCSREVQASMSAGLETFAADLAALGRQTALRTGCRPPVSISPGAICFFLTDAAPAEEWLAEPRHRAVIIQPAGTAATVVDRALGTSKTVSAVAFPPGRSWSPAEIRSIVSALLTALPGEGNRP